MPHSGSVWSWGWGAFGRLGHRDQPNRSSRLLPKRVEAFAGQRVVAVSAGAAHSLGLTADGSVWSWGYGGEGRLGHGDEQNQLLPKKIQAFAGQRVVAVSAGDAHSLAITADGAVWSWGEGAWGGPQNQLAAEESRGAFVGPRVFTLSAGGFHSLASTADGAVFTWGKGESGCLGHGEDLSDQRCPRRSRRGSRGSEVPSGLYVKMR